MGVEFAIIASVAGGFLQASQQMSQAKKQAQADVAQGNLAVNELGSKAQQVARKGMATAGTQKTSFLTSGLALEGTPYSVISDTYSGLGKDLSDIGKDIGTTSNFYNTKAKNAISAGRSAAIGSIISGFTSAYTMGQGTGAFSDWFSSSTPSIMEGSGAVSGIGTNMANSGYTFGSNTANMLYNPGNYKGATNMFGGIR
jgi:hypothetical protein